MRIDPVGLLDIHDGVVVDIEAPRRHHQAQEPTNRSQHQRLHQQLTNDPKATRTQRRTYRHLFRT